MAYSGISSLSVLFDRIKKKSSGTEVHDFIEILTDNPLKDKKNPTFCINLYQIIHQNENVICPIG